MKTLKNKKMCRTTVNGYNVLLNESLEAKAEELRIKKFNKIFGMIIVLILAVAFVLNIIIMPLTGGIDRKVSKVADSDNQYIIDDGLYLSAHRAGGGLKPEETKAAFRLCLEATDYKVDVLEFDLHLTKDGQLVLLHDHELGRTSNGEQLFFKGVKVCDLTLEQLETVNFGYNFVDPETNEMPYHYDMTPAQIKEKEIGIFTLYDLLEYVESERPDKSMHYIIEIKDNNENGKISMDKLYAAMNEFGILDRTIVGTFHDKITKYIDSDYVEKGVVRSASIVEVLNVYYSFLYGVEKEYKFGVLQIPPLLKGFFDLGSAAFINYAHNLGIAVQYWTINDPETVIRLRDNGADCIMTDDPKMAFAALGWTL